MGPVDDDDDDADTTAAQDAPVVSFAESVASRDVGAELADGPDAEDATVQRLPEALRDSSPDGPARVTGARACGPARPPMPTLLGTGIDDGSVTASANVRILGLPGGAAGPAPPAAAPRGAPPDEQSQESERPQESFEDTEARTVVASVEALEDSVTAQGPTVRVPTPVEVHAPAIRISPKSLFDPHAAPPSATPMEPPTAPRLKSESVGELPTGQVLRPASAPGPVATSGPEPEGPGSGRPVAPDPYESGDSITTLGPAVVEDSATATRGAPLPSSRLPPVTAPDDATDGTARRPIDPLAESGSVTAQAPGHLTNMLRVIAADAPRATAADADEDDEDDDLPANQTAVMPNSPYYLGMTGGAPVVSPPHAHSAGAPPRDHASMGVLALPPHGAAGEPRSGSVPRARPSASGPARPPYVALVALAALLSITVPVAVFFALRGAGEEVAPSPRAPSTPSSEIVKRAEPARIKAPRTAPAPRVRRR